MNKIYFTSILLFFVVSYCMAQPGYYQYFDGADTSATNSIIIQIDANSSNIWQVGKPQKNIFNSAATFPNAMVTDTINNYPNDNISRFSFKIIPWFTWGLLAIQWQQKLDMDLHHDGGIIEYSVDSGNTWSNVFNDPHVYNFYGFQLANADTLLTGEYALSGTDTTWRDIWLCFDMTWLSLNDSIYFRYTFKSDSVNNNKEGWMIDNMMAHISIMHPVKEINKKDYLNVYPNPTKDIVNIEIQKIQDFHIIENMKLVNSEGILIKEWKNIPTKFWFDTKKYPDGIYFLTVKTNIKSETIPVVVKKN
ncbi:MAG: T9SS type A sorting domain-containing protein [Bacteroidia bacterium]